MKISKRNPNQILDSKLSPKRGAVVQYNRGTIGTKAMESAIDPSTERNPIIPDICGMHLLTERERTILDLLVRETPIRGIASALGVSESAILNTLTNIKHKLN